MHSSVKKLIVLFAITQIFPFHTFSQTCTDPNLYADECDFDGDGLINVSDLDDDNDGVLDTTEQDCFLSNNLTDGLAAGFHPMDTWLLTHGVRIRHIDIGTLTANTTDFRVLNHPSWVAQGDPDNKLIWNGTGISIAFFAPNGVTPETTNSFSIWSDRFPIPPPTGLVHIIARDINGIDILDRFDPDGSQHIIDISHTGGVPIHEIVLAFSSSAFDLVSLSGSCLDRDTDLDTFADRFDLDSDGDGCADAFESGATADITTNFQFSDATGDPDGLSPTVDPGGDGQPDYTSTYAPDANDITVNNCPTVLASSFLELVLSEVENQVQLNWKGDFDESLSHFKILRSVDQNSWEIIGRLIGEEKERISGEYSFPDLRPLIGLAYYKIIAEDENGVQTYSNIQSINLDINQRQELILFPNPFESKLHIYGLQFPQSQLHILDINGKEVDSFSLPKSVNGQEFILNLEKLPQGVYFLRSGKTFYKIIKKP